MSRKSRRLSDRSAAVLMLFLREPGRERFGLEIIKDAELESGLLYPILHRFEERGILTAAWEDQEKAVAAGRRARRLYKLDPDKATVAEQMLEEWANATRSADWAPRLGPKEALA